MYLVEHDYKCNKIKHIKVGKYFSCTPVTLSNGRISYKTSFLTNVLNMLIAVAFQSFKVYCIHTVYCTINAMKQVQVCKRRLLAA